MRAILAAPFRLLKKAYGKTKHPSLYAGLTLTLLFLALIGALAGTNPPPAPAASTTVATAVPPPTASPTVAPVVTLDPTSTETLPPVPDAGTSSSGSVNVPYVPHPHVGSCVGGKHLHVCT